MWNLNNKKTFGEALANKMDIVTPANDLAAIPHASKSFGQVAIARKPVPKPRIFAGAAFNMNGIAY